MYLAIAIINWNEVKKDNNVQSLAMYLAIINWNEVK